MAAPGCRGEVRVRLTFEYPPPALPQSRHLWFILDTEQCRAVTDVSAIIRERFFYSRRGALTLYLDGCLLPPGESVRLIRDNDAISVKWEEPEDESADRRRRPEDGSADCRKSLEDGSADRRRRPEDGSADCRKRRRISEDESYIPKKTRKRAVPERVEDGSDNPTKSKKKGGPGSAEDESDDRRRSRKRVVPERVEDGSDNPTKSKKKGGPGSAEDESDYRRRSRKNGGPERVEDGSDNPTKSKNKGGPGSAEDESDSPRKSRKNGGPERVEDGSDNPTNSKKKGGPGSVEDESDSPRKSRKNGGPERVEDGSDNPTKSKKKGGPGSAEDESDDRRRSRKRVVPERVEDGSDNTRKSKKKGGPGSAEDESDYPRKSRKNGGPERVEDGSDNPRKSKNKGGPGSAEDESDSPRKSRKNGGPGRVEDRSYGCMKQSGFPEKTKRRAEVTLKEAVWGRREEVSAEASEKKPPYQQEAGGPVHKEAPPLLSSSRAAATSSSSSSDQEGTGQGEEPGQGDGSIMKKPLISGLASSSSVCNGRGARGGTQHRPPLKTAGRGLHRGRGIDNLPWGGRGLRGRGEAQPQKHFFYNYSPEKVKEQQLSEDLSNVSVLIQNPLEVQRPDYGTLPLLAAPPQPGKIIAFKLLELTENYTPEVSDYKEGRVLGYDAVSQQLEVEILSQQRRKEPGKFDLVYEGEDGRNIVEYAVPQECKISQAWSSLIEPRLVTEHASPAAGP